MTDAQKPFRVLSLDGGRFRGLYTATLLHTLSKRFATRNSDHLDIGKAFDLIVGTSTGGILACGLAVGLPLQHIVDIYVQNGTNIFSDPMPSKLGKYELCLGWGKRNRRKPSCNADALRQVLTNSFGTKTIESVYNEREIALCIPSIDAETHNPWVFKTPHHSGKTRDNNYPLVEVCLATSAAPIYFPIHKCSSPDNKAGKQFFVDGGLWANNPILVGLTEALTLTTNEQDIEIVSVGTLPTPVGSVIKNTHKGIKDWLYGTEILLLSMDAQASGFDYIAHFIANSLPQKCTVHRIDKNKVCPSPDQAKHLAMDNASNDNIQVLTKMAESAADRIHGEEMSALSRGESSVVADIFSNLEPIGE